MTKEEIADAILGSEDFMWLMCGGDPYSVSEASTIILATKNHESKDPTVQLFLDADMSILGAPPEMYTLYKHQIREEYSQYSDQDYNSGRLSVLTGFYTRPRIFLTDEFYGFEAQARENIFNEIYDLTKALL